MPLVPGFKFEFRGGALSSAFGTYLALSRHCCRGQARPLLGVKRTSLFRALMSANDPKRTSHWSKLLHSLWPSSH